MKNDNNDNNNTIVAEIIFVESVEEWYTDGIDGVMNAKVMHHHITPHCVIIKKTKKMKKEKYDILHSLFILSYRTRLRNFTKTITNTTNTPTKALPHRINNLSHLNQEQQAFTSMRIQLYLATSHVEPAQS